MIKAAIKGDIFDLTHITDLITNATEDIELTINSPGGSAIEGANVARAIISNTEVKVTANIETMAASAAAVIALSCDAVKMTKMDVLILHHCWTMAIGNKEDLEQEIDAMKHIDAILEEYLTKHCKDETKAEELKQMLEQGDVFLNAEEAAELFDNIEIVEIPGKGEKQNRVNLAKLVNDYKAAVKELAELKAARSEPHKEEKDQYSPEVLAIINEVL